MAVITPTAKAQFLDATGAPLVGGLVYTYAAGTTTPQATYTDSAGTQPNTNPIVLDARGEANIWLGSATYKFKLCASDNTELWTVDNISAPTSGLSPVLSGNVVIDSDSSGTALTIIQTNTGLALKIEDQTSDTTPFVVDNAGNVGIRTLAPATALDVNDGTIQLSSSGTSRTTIAADASNTTLTSVGTRGLILAANSANLIYGTSSGFVGIKNASPTVELDVTGAFKTSGAITGGSTIASGTTLTAGSSLTVTTSASIGTTLSVDTVQEKTSSAGVSVDNTLKVDTISGKTSANTVTLAGIAIASSQIPASNRLITAATAQTSTSGGSIPFTSIPSWVKRITIMLSGVSLTSTDTIEIQLGTTSGYETSGYLGTYTSIPVGGTPGGANLSSSFIIGGFAATYTLNGVATLCLLTTDTWAFNCVMGSTTAGVVTTCGGSKVVAATLDRLQIIATTGTFDAGTINILYE